MQKYSTNLMMVFFISFALPLNWPFNAHLYDSMTGNMRCCACWFFTVFILVCVILAFAMPNCLFMGASWKLRYNAQHPINDEVILNWTIFIDLMSDVNCLFSCIHGMEWNLQSRTNERTARHKQRIKWKILSIYIERETNAWERLLMQQNQMGNSLNGQWLKWVLKWKEKNK